jgi:polyphosphate kinase 2
MARVPKKRYEAELYRLQLELLHMQAWVQSTGARLVVLFEGRDAAGKGGVIKRIIEHLNPRTVRVVALPKPTDRERGEWYFQRYVSHLPTSGEVVLFDRSWYNRAGVERVMGFCSDEEHARFLRAVPAFEQMLIDDGIMLRKYWFSVSAEEQHARFQARADEAHKRWKLSPMDLASLDKWSEYSHAKDEMFAHTDTEASPWYVVDAEDQRHARLDCIHHLLSTVPYEAREPQPLDVPPRQTAMEAPRPPKHDLKWVPSWHETLLDG